MVKRRLLGPPFFVSARSLAGFISGMDNGCPAIIVDRKVPCPAIGGMGGDECSDFKNPIGRTFLSGNCIFAETGKSRLSGKRRRACPVLTGWAGSFTAFCSQIFDRALNPGGKRKYQFPMTQLPTFGIK